MRINTDIITRILFSFIFFAITLRVLGPIFFDFFKKKILNQQTNENDIDSMIKRQKEKLRAEYRLYNTPPKEMENIKKSEMPDIFKKNQWGDEPLLKEIQNEISKNYSYSISNTKISNFINLCEKRNYLQLLSTGSQTSKIAFKNFLIAMLIYFLVVEEIREEKFFILEKTAKKLGLRAHELALAFQIKLLLLVNNKKELKEERIYSENLIVSQFPEEIIKDAVEAIAKNEANIWARNPSLLFEELILAINYATILSPIQKIKNKKDIKTACDILGITLDQNIEDIKKTYKKIALLKHPDKIVSQKLPAILEKRAISKFNQVQEAYEIIIAHKR